MGSVGSEVGIRPLEISPIFDKSSLTAPLADYNLDLFQASFQTYDTPKASAAIPPKPSNFNDDYLIPMLAHNERMRLNMFWYYTRDARQDTELLRRIQEKVNLVKDFLGWEIAVCGLLDNDVFERFVTAGLPLAVVPRRESPCSHTLVQTPGSVLMMANMSEDWRFKHSPVVAHGGLGSYAGTQLVCKTEEGEEVAIGTLCVASGTTGLTLTQMQQDTMLSFANMVSMEIVNQCRWSRQRQQQRMNQLVNTVSSETNVARVESKIMSIIREVYPEQEILTVTGQQKIKLSNGQLIPASELQHGIWENVNELQSIIVAQNHERLTTSNFVRAVSGGSRAEATAKYIVVASKDIRLVFDDIDVWFIEKCSSVLDSASQKASLAEALQVKEEFLRGITHQLRTPIHGVLGSVDLLAEELAARATLPTSPDPASGEMNKGVLDTDEVLGTIRNSGRELMSTLNNILKLHHWTETSKTDRNRSLLDILELESRIVDDVLSVLPHDSCSMIRVLFENRLLPEIKGITANATLLRECLQSIVLNALQATASGEVVITISASEDRSVLVFDVEDTGCGIPVADHERIFQAYEKSDIHTRGVGLGLTLARKMAASMDGTVTLVASSPEKGSHFRAEFKNPAFIYAACSDLGPDNTVMGPPLEYNVVNPQPDSIFLPRLVQCLAKQGFRPSAGLQKSIGIVEWTSDRQALNQALSATQSYKIGLCFLPPGAPLQQLKCQFPKVVFDTGALTTKRLKQVLSSVRQSLSEAQQASLLIARSASPSLSATSNLQRSKSTPLSSTLNGTSKPHCLLVDDNDVNLRLLRMFCDKRKYTYSLAIDGLEASQAYKQVADSNPVRLILLDLQMPKCTGIEACAEIRAFEKLRGLEPAIIFIVTGQDSEKDKEQSAAAGADEFFTKPLSFKVLDRAIAAYLQAPP